MILQPCFEYETFSDILQTELFIWLGLSVSLMKWRSMCHNVWFIRNILLVSVKWWKQKIYLFFRPTLTNMIKLSNHSIQTSDIFSHAFHINYEEYLVKKKLIFNTLLAFYPYCRFKCKLWCLKLDQTLLWRKIII